MSSDLTRDNRDYEVGYKRPPVSGRFKKGQSGNPSGASKAVRDRKVRAASFADLFSERMLQTVEVEGTGRKIRITRMHLAVRRRVEASAKGDMTALRELLKLHDVKAPVDVGREMVLTLDEVCATAKPLGVSLYAPDVVILREPKPGAKRRTCEEQHNRYRLSLAELIDVELDRQVQVTAAITGSTKRMSAREVIVEQLTRLFVAGKPGANDLIRKLDKLASNRPRQHKTYVGVPWDFEMPPRLDRDGRPVAVDAQKKAPLSSS